VFHCSLKKLKEGKDTYGYGGSKSTGEPPAVSANSVILAIRDAIFNYRKIHWFVPKEDEELDDFVLDAPATTTKIVSLCREPSVVPFGEKLVICSAFVDNQMVSEILNHPDAQLFICLDKLLSYSDPEMIYNYLNDIILALNQEIAWDRIDPLSGKVSFGSIREKWEFTIPQFAEFIKKQNGDRHQKDFLKYLWGDHYYDPKDKNLYKKKREDGSRIRYAVKMIFQPILNIYTCLQKRKMIDHELTKILITSNVEKSDLDPNPSKAFHFVMRKWLATNIE